MVDKKFVKKIGDNEFITHEGLLNEFHVNGGDKITTELISSENGVYLFKATAEGKRGMFTGHGDASKDNVTGKVSQHFIRMAETRAVNRSLRLYNNIGMCSSDELGGDKEKKEPKANDSLQNSVEVPLVCSECDEKITEPVKKFSIDKFGKTLCFKCQKNQNKNDK